MRKVMLMAIVGLFASVVIVGCSSDDNKSTGPSAAEQFELLQPNLDAIAVEVLDVFADGYDKADDFDTTMGGIARLARPLSPDTDTSYTFDYYYQNGWHISQYHWLFGETFLDLVDSTKFTNDAGMPQLWPDEATTDGVRSIDHLESASEMEGSNLAMTVFSDFSFDGFLSEVVTVDGLAKMTIQVTNVQQYGQASADFTTSIVLNNVIVQNDGNGCPESGNMVLSISGTVVDFDDEGQQYSVQIDATATFQFDDSGVYNVVVLIGGSQFSYTFEACS